MTSNATEHHIDVSESQLAHIGEGIVAYMREMQSEELNGKFPMLPKIQPGTRLWALFAANGQPILLADNRAHLLASALENDLTPVAIH
ncbi:MAG: DUF1150 family protein [Rhizobiaceae bacterium]|nr:DUF1150 family protein [Rhizobiaceae bacterium]